MGMYARRSERLSEAADETYGLHDQIDATARRTAVSRSELRDLPRPWQDLLQQAYELDRHNGSFVRLTQYTNVCPRNGWWVVVVMVMVMQVYCRTKRSVDSTTLDVALLHSSPST